MFKQAMRTVAPNSRLGYDLPDPTFFEDLELATQYTPDIAILEQFEYQFFFSCDETQIGHHKHDLLGEAEYRCPGFTQKAFNYWDPKVPFLPPIPMEAEVSQFRKIMPFYPDPAKIKGQVLLIRPQAFLKLDPYKEQGVQYVRTKARILVPHRAIRSLLDHPGIPTNDIEFELGNGLGLTFELIHIIRAWMYVGIPAYWDKLISAFDYGSVQTYQAKNRLWCPQYYQYRRPPKLE